MASNSQYSANISLAASLLYKLTGNKYYATEAAKAIQYTLQCQRTEPLKDKEQNQRVLLSRSEQKIHCALYPSIARPGIHAGAYSAL